MGAYVMVTRLQAGALEAPKSLETQEKKVMERIRAECPQVEWIHNYAILGPWDYLDVFSTPNETDAFKVATIIRSFGHAHTEIWAAREWGAYKTLIRDLPEGR